MTEQTNDRAPFACPYCTSEAIYRVTGTDGTYECFDCGELTHEEIEEHRRELEELAESDVEAARLAKLLVDP